MNSSSLLLCVFVLCIAHNRAIKWLALSQIPSDQAWNHTRQCPTNKIERKKYGLIGYQVKFCRRVTGIMPIIMRASRGTNYVCEKQFANRRWNCSSVHYAPYLNQDLTKGTREQAYVYALSSAAIVHQVAKACVVGEIPYCPCGATPNQVETGFKWKGCSDNVHYGARVSVEWADASWNARKSKREKIRGQASSAGLVADMSHISLKQFMQGNDQLSPRAKMNKHNNQVGREVAAQTLETKCKCHGVSSSCSLKTCWKVLPSLNSIGEKLRERYQRATEVRADKDTDRTGVHGRDYSSNVLSLPAQDNYRSATDSLRSLSNRPRQLQRVEFEPVALSGSVGPTDLVYVRKSPDYCTADGRVGSLGTEGRECNATVSGHGGCDSMCCGRGYQSKQLEMEENCHCKYVHCCYVKCKKCRYLITKNYCK